MYGTKLCGLVVTINMSVIQTLIRLFAIVNVHYYAKMKLCLKFNYTNISIWI